MSKIFIIIILGCLAIGLVIAILAMAFALVSVMVTGVNDIPYNWNVFLRWLKIIRKEKDE